MIRAGDQPRLQPALAFLAKLRAAMPARVVEGTQLAGVVAQHEDFLRTNAEGAERQRLGKIGLAADEQPVPVPDGVEIALIVVLVPIGR
ncbi:hypothetical protein ACVWWD_004874 [Mesorhizobium sp. URHB0026]